MANKEVKGIKVKIDPSKMRYAVSPEIEERLKKMMGKARRAAFEKGMHRFRDAQEYSNFVRTHVIVEDPPDDKKALDALLAVLEEE